MDRGALDQAALDQAAIDRAAAALVAARGGTPLDALPESCRPASEADAYRIQDAVLHALGERAGGWKVGAAGPDAAPFYAPILASAVHPSPAALPASGFRLYGIEGEIGFRLTRALPARPRDYEPDEIAAALSLHPTIEIVESRYADFRALDRLSVLADNFSNGALVFGAAFAGDWRHGDLVHPPIAITADGAPFAESSGNRAGEPLRLVVALVNHVARRHGEVPAGTVVTTGSHTGLVFSAAGTRLHADHGRFGGVDIAFRR
jgi:2-keto-4-pentenoate hydratase